MQQAPVTPARPGQTPGTYVNPQTGQQYGVTSNPGDVNSIVAGMVDRTPWRFYDTYNNPAVSPAVAVTNQVAFFQVPINGTDPVTKVAKTELDTNMTSPGQFSPPYCLVLYQIGFHIISTDKKADIDSIFNNCYMHFRILGKDFFTGLPWMYPSGYGMMGQNLTSTDQNWTNGFPAPQATYRLTQFPRYIPPLTQFYLTLFFPGTPPPTLVNNFKLVAFLDGLTDLPVQ
jgi:hypothetical protein